MKNLFIIGVTGICLLIFGSVSFACEGCGSHKVTRIDHNIVNTSTVGANHSSVTNSGNVNSGNAINSNNGNVGSVRAYGGHATADANARAYGGDAVIEKGAIKNNVNANAVIEKGAVTNNVNTNIHNKNKQKQGQQQGQDQQQRQLQKQNQDQNQHQNQGQDQSQSANNEGNFQTINQNFEDKRDHITGPEILNPDTKFNTGQPYIAKTIGVVEFFKRVNELTIDQAKKLSSEASDIGMEPSLIQEKDFSVDRVKFVKGKMPGELLGFIYLTSTGSDTNVIAMIGKAAQEAMKIGATHMKLIKMHAGSSSTGSAWNIGIGGGASIMKGSDDSVAIAPNAGTGYGKAKASNELRPEMVFELTFDERVLKVNKTEKFSHNFVENDRN